MYLFPGRSNFLTVMLLDFPLSTYAAPLLAMLISYGTNLWLVRRKMVVAIDYPNSRSLHVTPVPRVGGIGLFSGVLLVWAVFPVNLPLQIWLGVNLLIGVSAADDLWKTPVWCRLAVHGLVAVLFSFFTFGAYDWYIQLIFILTLVWIMNLYNFMVGSDGLAGGMALIGFCCYGLMAALSGNMDFALVNVVIAAAASGFLILNFHPARIFMGDAGSIPLGYLAAAMGLLGWVYDLWSLWAPLLVFSPFIVDASVTLAKRLWCGETIWQAHRKHYYQRLVQSGFGHRKTALFGYGLMLSAGACAVWMNFQALAVQWIIVTMWGLIYLGLMVMADKKLHSNGL